MWTANLKQQIFQELLTGRTPSQGRFDAEALAEARRRGTPQIGTVNYEPRAATFEFPFVETGGATQVVSVEIDPPERIVALSVPEWVVENVWHGEVSGSFEFESDAMEMVRRFMERLDPGANLADFEPRPPIGRA